MQGRAGGGKIYMEIWGQKGLKKRSNRLEGKREGKKRIGRQSRPGGKEEARKEKKPD